MASQSLFRFKKVGTNYQVWDRATGEFFGWAWKGTDKGWRGYDKFRDTKFIWDLTREDVATRLSSFTTFKGKLYQAHMTGVKNVSFLSSSLAVQVINSMTTILLWDLRELLRGDEYEPISYEYKVSSALGWAVYNLYQAHVGEYNNGVEGSLLHYSFALKDLEEMEFRQDLLDISIVYQQYRCTRNKPYLNKNCSGATNPRDRQGYYLTANSVTDALQHMGFIYPDEISIGFTAEIWS